MILKLKLELHLNYARITVKLIVMKFRVVEGVGVSLSYV